MRGCATEQDSAPKGSELDSLLRQYEQIWSHMEQEEAAQRSTEQGKHSTLHGETPRARAAPADHPNNAFRR